MKLIISFRCLGIHLVIVYINIEQFLQVVLISQRTSSLSYTLIPHKARRVFLRPLEYGGLFLKKSFVVMLL